MPASTAWGRTDGPPCIDEGLGTPQIVATAVLNDVSQFSASYSSTRHGELFILAHVHVPVLVSNSKIRHKCTMYIVYEVGCFFSNFSKGHFYVEYLLLFSYATVNRFD